MSHVIGYFTDIHQVLCAIYFFMIRIYLHAKTKTLMYFNHQAAL